MFAEGEHTDGAGRKSGRAEGPMFAEGEHTEKTHEARDQGVSALTIVCVTNISERQSSGKGEEGIYMVMEARSIMPLEVKTFGVFDVLFDRKTIFTESTSARAIGLLKYLIIVGQSVKNQDIMQTLYQKNGETQAFAKKAFQSDLRSLYKLLAFENAFKRDFSEYIQINDEDGACSVKLSENVRTDADRFSKISASIVGSNEKFFLKKYFGQLESLFAKRYMAADIEEDWEAAYYERFMKSYCGCVGIIIDKLVDQQGFQEVAEICEKCVEVYDAGRKVNVNFLNALIESGVIKKALHNVSGAVGREETTARQDISGKTSVEAIVSRSDSDSFSEITLKDFIDEAIKNYMVNYGLKYHMALIEITENECMTDEEAADYTDVAEPMKELHDALEGVLRKKDMYVVFSKSIAVAILYGVRTEYLDNIEKRICGAFLEKTRRNVSISVVIMPVTDVD